MHILYVHTTVCELKEIFMYKEELIMKKRLEALKKDQKGFTLVELIVVLVILAILAALLVPALLGYIDRAKDAKYFEEARSIYTALQVIEDERYAAGNKEIATGTTFNGTASNTAAYTLTANESTEVNNLVAPAALTAIGAIDHYSGDAHKEHTIKGLKITFTSQDGESKTAQMVGNGTWEMVNP